MSARGIVLLVVALLAGGCAGQAADGGESPVVQPRWESCAAVTPEEGTEGLALPKLDDSFVPVSAVICRTVPVRRPSGGEDMVAAEDKAGDIAGLLATLRLPDEKPTNGACTADLVLVPYLVLLDADGRWIRPGVPVDACRKPRIEFRDALGQLKTERVSGRVVLELESDEAAASGCGQAWADMVWVIGENGGGNASLAPLAPENAEVRRCVYRVPAKEQGGAKPAGEFETGGKLPAGTWAAVRRELTNAAPAGRCTTPASRFAVLTTPAGEVYVEGDGCRRALLGETALRTATPALEKLLF
ncbi:hypothetical protein BJ973_002799 [Actinoplanes tereljensis]|uniref:Lipoprotein n=1 Tax=Paractinoplanes tereljensis TaxID=571912 RepID=A0A919TUN0_9ACTN|nr:hypothetical protein [Actinoplanes tereljensis]GIF22474.1 hypothetical protein Ate02nite_52040 [Actinoplanes tereljensis]